MMSYWYKTANVAQRVRKERQTDRQTEGEVELNEKNGSKKHIWKKCEIQSVVILLSVGGVSFTEVSKCFSIFCLIMRPCIISTKILVSIR